MEAPYVVCRLTQRTMQLSSTAFTWTMPGATWGTAGRALTRPIILALPCASVLQSAVCYGKCALQGSACNSHEAEEVTVLSSKHIWLVVFPGRATVRSADFMAALPTERTACSATAAGAQEVGKFLAIPHLLAPF